MMKGGLIVLGSLFFLPFVTSFVPICNRAPLSALGYQILGGIDNDHSGSSDDKKENEVTEVLRHLNNFEVSLTTQSHDPGGGVSMAGTLWESGPVLADFITNPDCPIDAFRRLHGGVDEEDRGSSMPTGITGSQPPPVRPPMQQPQWHRSKPLPESQFSPTTVVELGAGIGLTSLAAAILGCHVVATDGSPSSLRLCQENFSRYESDCMIPPQVAGLEWGDDDAVRELMNKNLDGCAPDVVMASDVVYAHSAREELAGTIRMLCPPVVTGGGGETPGKITTVLLAHRWRAEPKSEEEFFRLFDDDFDRVELSTDFLPPGEYYRRRSMLDGKFPVSIFEMRRKRR